jgi:hypothetical protein
MATEYELLLPSTNRMNHLYGCDVVTRRLLSRDLADTQDLNTDKIGYGARAC